MSTRNKLKVAKVASAIATTARRLIGLPTRAVVTRRRGIVWELDLLEGIDLAIYLFGAFERSTASALQRATQPGMTVLDIGANVGAHALPLARHVGPSGHVYAIEPTDWAFGKLQRNRALNPAFADALIPVQAAFLSPRSHAPGGFFASWDVNGAPDAHPIHRGVPRAATAAEFTTLDDFVRNGALRRVDLIKIDVDGLETHVLRGGEQMLRAFHPALFFEFCPYALEESGSSAIELLELLRGLGYDVHEESGRRRLTNAAAIGAVPLGGSVNLFARARS